MQPWHERKSGADGQARTPALVLGPAGGDASTQPGARGEAMLQDRDPPARGP